MSSSREVHDLLDNICKMKISILEQRFTWACCEVSPAVGVTHWNINGLYIIWLIDEFQSHVNLPGGCGQEDIS